jgi:hypothetical protein
MFGKNENVQYKRTKIVQFSYADLVANGSGAFLNAIDLPTGAIVTGGNVFITTAFNSVTSDTGTVGDATTNGRYKTGINMQTVGVTPLVPTGAILGNGGLTDMEVGIAWTGVGTAPTAGAGILQIDYVTYGGGDEFVS